MVEQETEEDDEDDEEESDSRASPTPGHKRALTGGPLATLQEGQSFEEGISLVDDEAEEAETTMDGDASRATGDVSMGVEDESEGESEEESEEEESEEEASVGKFKARTPHKQRIVSDDEDYEQGEDEEDEEDSPPPPPTKVKRESIGRTPGPPAAKAKAKSPRGKEGTPLKVKREPMSPIPVKQEDIEVELGASGDKGADESMSVAAIVPNKRVRAAHLAASGPGSTYIPSPGEPEAVKKKKR